MPEASATRSSSAATPSALRPAGWLRGLRVAVLPGPRRDLAAGAGARPGPAARTRAATGGWRRLSATARPRPAGAALVPGHRRRPRVFVPPGRLAALRAAPRAGNARGPPKAAHPSGHPRPWTAGQVLTGAAARKVVGGVCAALRAGVGHGRARRGRRRAGDRHPAGRLRTADRQAVPRRPRARPLGPGAKAAAEAHAARAIAGGEDAAPSWSTPLPGLPRPRSSPPPAETSRRAAGTPPPRQAPGSRVDGAGPQHAGRHAPGPGEPMPQPSCRARGKSGRLRHLGHGKHRPRPHHRQPADHHAGNSVRRPAEAVWRRCRRPTAVAVLPAVRDERRSEPARRFRIATRALSAPARRSAGQVRRYSSVPAQLTSAPTAQPPRKLGELLGRSGSDTGAWIREPGKAGGYGKRRCRGRLRGQARMRRRRRAEELKCSAR